MNLKHLNVFLEYHKLSICFLCDTFKVLGEYQKKKEKRQQDYFINYSERMQKSFLSSLLLIPIACHGPFTKFLERIVFTHCLQVLFSHSLLNPLNVNQPRLTGHVRLLASFWQIIVATKRGKWEFAIPPLSHYQVIMKASFRANSDTCTTLARKQAQKEYKNTKSLSFQVVLTTACWKMSLRQMTIF